MARLALLGFSKLAAVCMAVLAITGLYNMGWQVASLDALLFTLYGQAVLWKVGLVILVGMVGLLNAAGLHSGLASLAARLFRRPGSWGQFVPHRMRRSLLVEATGGIGVLFLAAYLGATQPARGPEFNPPAEGAATPSSVTAQVADLLVTLSIKPNLPGQNFVTIGVFDTRRPSPAPINQVEVQFIPPGGQQLVIHRTVNPVGNGRYQFAGDAIDVAGDWQVSVSIHRPGLADTISTFPWTVMPLQSSIAARPVRVSNRRLAPFLNLSAVIIACTLAGTGMYYWLKRRPVQPILPGVFGTITHHRSLRKE